MNKLSKFFECKVPVSICNLQCSYCYVRYRKANTNKQYALNYSESYITESLSQNRLGGCCFFSFCGSGETTMYNQMPMLAKAVVANGHYMNITSNGTFSTGIQNILSYCKEYATQILFSFSLHYNELQQKKLLDKFISNVNLVKKYGASYIITLVLNKQYYKKQMKLKNLQ